MSEAARRSPLPDRPFGGRGRARGTTDPGRPAALRASAGVGTDQDLVRLFHEHFESLYRYLDRLSGEPDLASDLAQEAFIRLYRRDVPPDDPRGWLFTVATNLFRNARAGSANRRRLLTPWRSLKALADRPPAPDAGIESDETARAVRLSLDRLPVRERSLLLLSAEGHSYRDIAGILDLNEASVGTLLRRAKQAFRSVHQEATRAP